MKIKQAKEKNVKIKKASNMSIKVKEGSIKQIAKEGVALTTQQVEGGDEIVKAATIVSLASKPVIESHRKSIRFLSAHRKKEQEKKTETRYVGKKPNASEKKSTKEGKKKERKLGIKSIINPMRLFLAAKGKTGSESRQQLEEEESLQLNGTAVTLVAIVGAVLVLVAVLMIPIFATISWLYHSPVAVLCPPLEEGDTVYDVTQSCLTTFYQEVELIATLHEGCDEGRVVYEEYEGAAEGLTNIWDVIAVYMVQYGTGEAATIINETARDRIQEVVDAMCSYTTSIKTEEVLLEGESPIEQQVLCVNVALKTYEDMISVYGFTEEQVAMLEYVVSHISVAQLPNGAHQRTVSIAEMRELLAAISDPQAQTACQFALFRVGYPYSQEYRDSGQYYDCSSLVYYAWMEAGVNISHGGSNTAASEAKGLEEADKQVSLEEIQPGDLIFWSFCNNGRYKNISHVGIYVGNGKVVEAYNQREGVIFGDIKDEEDIVTICRP